jgi:hypothetical protein
MVKKIVTALLMFGLAVLFAHWFIVDLRRDTPVGVWNFVIYVVAVLVFVACGIAVFLPDRQGSDAPSNGHGIQVQDDHTVVHDGVAMTVHQVALMDALREASKLGADATVRIGVDQATGKPRYEVVRRS